MTNERLVRNAALPEPYYSDGLVSVEKEVIAEMLRNHVDPHEVMNYVRAKAKVDPRHTPAVAPLPTFCEFDGEGWPCSAVREAMAGTEP